MSIHIWYARKRENVTGAGGTRKPRRERLIPYGGSGMERSSHPRPQEATGSQARKRL